MPGNMRLMNLDNLKNKKILITGGTGFIGKRAVNILSQFGAVCYVITRRDIPDTDNIHYIKMDLSSSDTVQYEDLFNKYGEFDAAIYMAANIPVIGQKKETYAEAVSSTLIPLVQFAQNVCGRIKNFVYTSTIDIVGVPEKINYTEDCELNAFTPYGLAKLSGEFYMRRIAAATGTVLKMLRFSQVYGPNEPIVRIIPILLDAVKNDKCFKLYGTGNEKRRFLYVDDAVQAIVKAVEYPESDVFNIAGASNDSILDLINISQKVYNKKLNIEKINVECKTFDNIPDITKAEKLLGFVPEFTLEKGIEKIYHE